MRVSQSINSSTLGISPLKILKAFHWSPGLQNMPEIKPSMCILACSLSWLSVEVLKLMIPSFLLGRTTASFSPLFNKFIVSKRAIFLYRLKAWGFTSNKLLFSITLKDSSSMRSMRMISSLICVILPAVSRETRQSHHGSKRDYCRYNSALGLEEDFFLRRGRNPGGSSFFIELRNSARVRIKEEEARSVDSRGWASRARCELVRNATLDFLQRVASMQTSINFRRVIELLFIYLDYSLQRQESGR